MSDVDLLMACILFQKQIDCIDGKAEKIVKPSTGVLEIRKQAGTSSILLLVIYLVLICRILCSKTSSNYH
jgi:hypothetical protein